MSETTTPPRWLHAHELSGAHLDEVIRFQVNNPDTLITHVVTGELREIHHHGQDTTVRIGEQGAEEHVLAEDQPIVLHPSVDYCDWGLFNGEDLSDDTHA